MPTREDEGLLRDRLDIAEKKIADLETSRSLMRKELERVREQHKVYRTLVEEAFFGARVGVILLDSKFKVAWVNRSIERYFGISAKEMVGKDKRRLIKEKISNIFEDPQSFEQRVRASYDDNSYVENFECHVLPGPRRQERWLEHWSEPIAKGLFNGGRIEAYIDITDSVRARKRLQYLTKLLHAIRKINQLIVTEKNMDKLLQGVCEALVDTGAYFSTWIALFDDEGRVKKTVEYGVGPEFKQMKTLLEKMGAKACTSNKPEEEVGAIIVQNPHEQCTTCPLSQFYGSKGAIRARLRHKDKIYGIMVSSLPKEFTMDLECKELFSEVAGDLAFALHALELDQLRRKTEDALRASELRYKMLYEYAGEPIFTYDKDLILTDVNTAACEKIGLQKHELVGRNILELGLLHPADVEKAMDHIKELLEGKELVRERLRFKGKDGDYLVADVTATTIKEGGKLVAVTNVCHDFTEKERLYKAVKKSEEKFRLLSENAPDVVFSLGSDGMITYVNPAVREILGYEPQELIGMYPTELAKEESRKLFVQLFRRINNNKESLSNIRISLLDKKHTEHMFLLSCSSIEEATSEDISVIGMLKDVTEQHKLEKQLRQAQKMEAIGTLAGGIAHDFNNILSSVIGYSELALMDLAEDSEVRENIQQVLNAAARARDLVRQILSFSRQGEQRRGPISVVPIVKEALKLMRASLPATIRIVQEIEKEPGVIEGDPTEIHQILMNLCTNAEHAMRRDGGVLEVRVEKTEVSTPRVLRGGELRPGSYVRLTVTDTGHGMDQYIIDRIFDPYFTTKRNGEGTGLGLAVVHGIVNSYGGAIEVKSEVGKGTTFEIYFPACEGEVASVEAPAEIVPTGHESILFVDDEEELAHAGKLMLEKLGYQVTVRTSSVEALELFRADPERFDLVITDLTMPNMSGDRLASKIFEIRPDIPIILCTGFSRKITDDSAKMMGISSLLMKPITMKELANSVRGVLDRAKNGKLVD